MVQIIDNSNFKYDGEVEIRTFEMYQVILREVGVHETHRWTRFNSYLIVNSLLFLSLVQLMVNIDDLDPSLQLIVNVFCVLGIGGGIIGMLLGKRMSGYMGIYLRAARYYERAFPIDHIRPIIDLSDENKRRNKLERKLGVSSAFLVSFTPLVFSMVYGIFLYIINFI